MPRRASWWRDLVGKLLKVRTAEFGTLGIFLVVAAMCFTFLRLADEVGSGGTRAFDKAVMLSMRSAEDPNDPLGPDWFEEAARDITSLGSATVIGLIALAVIGFLVMSGARAAALLMFASVGGGIILVSLLKDAFSRGRPDLVPHAVRVFSASFPSGHATMSAVAYLTLGALLGRMQTSRAIKMYLLSVAIVLTILVGVSRVYLGVHWPTDVLAGWCVGAAWAIACWVVLVRLQRSGSVERKIKPDAGAR